MSRANEHIKLLGLDSRRYDRGSFKSLTWIEPLLPLILLDLVQLGEGKTIQDSDHEGIAIGRFNDNVDKNQSTTKGTFHGQCGHYLNPSHTPP